MEPQIVAIGGGGFSDGSENLALENFILDAAAFWRLTGATAPRP